MTDEAIEQESNSEIVEQLNVFINSNIECTIKDISPEIGSISLVGVYNKEFPLNFGNYFSFASGNMYCLNMWAENLEEWMRCNPLEIIRVLEINDDRKFCLVVDNQIPTKWLNTKLRYTGCGVMSSNMLKIIRPYY